MTWNNSTVRELERESLRAFVASCSDWLTGSVLDFGCGKMPYRPIVEAAGGVYFGFDRAGLPGNVSGEDLGELWDEYPGHFDAVLCTQVLQYVLEPPAFIAMLARLLRPVSGALVMTYATNWPEVEREDLHRFTFHGMERLFDLAGLIVVKHERRAELNLNGYVLPLGGGIVGLRR